MIVFAVPPDNEPLKNFSAVKIKKKILNANRILNESYLQIVNSITQV